MKSSPLTRRFFLKQGALAFAAVGTSGLLGPGFLRSSALAAGTSSPRGGRRVLVCIFQRGAADGLSMLVPHGDPDYYRLRREIAIAPPGVQSSTAEQAINLDGHFGLHPSLAPLATLYHAGELAVLPACGNPGASRSHFEAQDLMESGVAGPRTLPTGWLNRLIGCCPEDAAHRAQIRAVALASEMPLSLQGPASALAIPDLDRFNISGGSSSNSSSPQSPEELFTRLYLPPDSSQDSTVIENPAREPGSQGLAALAEIRKIQDRNYHPEHDAQYPGGSFGKSLRQVAQLVKANVGLEVAFVQLGGWDTHVNQGSARGALATRLRELSEGLAAFHRDMGARMSEVLVLTMSEFGRTARQNGNRGTDHGYGTTFFALGGGVRGGRILGDWPGLSEEKLYEGRDLAITTDYRDFFAEACLHHMGIPASELPRIFPDHRVSPNNLRHYLA